MTYAKSKDLHKTLRGSWDPILKPLGYKRCKTSLASYSRPRHDGDGYVRLWVQASQWGESWSGNSFTLNFDLRISDPNDPIGGSDRILGDLTPEQLSQAELITQEIIERKPKPPPDHWVYTEMAEGALHQKLWIDSFARAFTYSAGQLKPNHDIWLEYFSIQDVAYWAEFLGPLIPNLIDNRERANVRFGKQLDKT